MKKFILNLKNFKIWVENMGRLLMYIYTAKGERIGTFN